MPPVTGTPASLLPSATYVGQGNGSDYIYANGTRLDCQHYVTGADIIGFVGNSSCGTVTEAFDVTLEDLLLWNPSLQAAPLCALNAGMQYCVQWVENIAENITQFCVENGYASPGQICNDFLAEWEIPVDVFASWNPTVGSDCSGFKTGKYLLHHGW